MKGRSHIPAKHGGGGQSHHLRQGKRNPRLRPVQEQAGGGFCCLIFALLLSLPLLLLSCGKSAATFNVSGRVVFAGDTLQGIKNAAINIEHADGSMQYVAVDTAGCWSVDLEAGLYIFSAMKRTDTLNGIDAADVLLLKQNLLGIAPFTNQWQWLASDVNANGISTTYDAFLTNAAMLNVGYAKDFIGGWWQFVPAEYEMPTLTDYWLPDYPTCIEIVLLSDIKDVNFVGFRRGDVNLNADPDK